MTLSEMAKLLEKDERTCRVILQQPNNPFGYAFKEDGGQKFKYVVNATTVLEFAGRQGVARKLVREVLRDDAKFTEWEKVLYPTDVSCGC